jgi:hypothetical protein
MMVERMFPELEIAKRAPRLVDWRERMTARPAWPSAARRGPHRAGPAHLDRACPLRRGEGEMRTTWPVSF